MAYGTKYNFTYTNEAGAVTLVNIDKKSYVGGNTTIEGGAKDPVIIRWFGEGEDKYMPVHGSEATIIINVTTDFQYSEFFEVADDEYRIDIKHDGNLFWRGFMIPDIYQEQYSQPPYSLRLRCLDGLGKLKGIDFTIPDPARQSVMKTIWDCLDQIDSETDKLALYEAVDLYETTMTVEQSSSPFSQCEINCNGFKDENNDAFDCHQVLTEVLKPFGCRIHQDNGAWWIVPVNLLDGTFVARKWNDWNDFDLTNSHISTAYDPTISTGTNKNIVGAQTVFSISPPYKKHITIFNAGAVSNLIPDGEFEELAWSSTTALAKWTENNLSIQKVGHVSEFSVWACQVTTSVTSLDTTKYLESTAVSISTGGGGVNNELSFKFQVKLELSGSGVQPNLYYELRIDPADGTADQYLQSDLTWTTTATRLKHDFALPAGLWEDVLLAGAGDQFFSIPKDGDLYVRFYAPVIPNTYTFGGMQLDRVISVLADENNVPVAEEVWTGTVTTNYSYVPSKKTKELDVMFGDVSQFASNDFNNGTLAQFDFDIGAITAGDSITMDLNTVTQTYTAVSSSPSDNQFTTSLELYTEILNDASTDYQVITDDTLNPTHFTIRAFTHDSNLNFGAVSEAGTTFSNLVKVDNVDPTTTEETGLHRGSITVNGNISGAWKRYGVSESKALLNLLTQRIMNNYQRPTRKLNGVFDQRTGTPLFSMVLDDPNDSSGAKYMMQGGVWMDYSSIWQGEWMEVVDSDVVATISSVIRPIVTNSVSSTIINTTSVGGGVGSGSQHVSVSVTSAEILTLNTSPKELIAAPGANKYIYVENILWEYIHVTTAYSATSTRFEWDDGVANTVVWPNLTGIQNAFSWLAKIEHTTSIDNKTGIVNKNFAWFAPSADPTTGNGTAVVHITYRIVDA